MLSRTNAVVHALSAIYSWVVAGIAAFMFQALASSRGWYALGLVGIASLGILDWIAALKQWKRPASGRLLSICLHFAVTVVVVAMITAAYVKGTERHSFRWFAANDFAFVTCLALLRLGLAVKLIRQTGMS